MKTERILFNSIGNPRYLHQRWIDLWERLTPRPFQRHVLRGKKDLVGVEVGVFRGINAKKFLDCGAVRQLYLVDPYAPYGEMPPEVTASAFVEMSRRLRNYYNAFHHRKFSHEAAAEFVSDRRMFDFVYIDAAHDPQSAIRDLECWWPLVKRGGFLAGHDFCNGGGYGPRNGGDLNGLITSICDFALARGLQLLVESPDWWIQKP